MKILFVTPYYKPYLGGIERVIDKLSHQFIMNFGVKHISVLTSKWSFPRIYHGDWLDREMSDREEIVRLRSWPEKSFPFFQVPLVWFSPRQIHAELKTSKPDVIQLMNDRWFWVNFWVVLSAKQLKIPVVFSLSFHQLTFQQRFLQPINWLLTRWVDRVIVITEHEKALIISNYRTPVQKITVVPWGIDMKEQNITVVNKSQNIVTILCVGRISKHKGQEWLANVYLNSDFIYPTQLVLVGAIENHDIATKLGSLSSNIVDTNKKIFITNEISDLELENWYTSADLFVLFPKYEAFGLVFLEAMSYGLPVLTHSVGAIQEVLQKGAILIEPFNREDAISKLSTLVNNELGRRQLGLKAKEYVENKFSWNNTAKQFYEAYNLLQTNG